MATVSQLYSYPIKSCGALNHARITLDERGPLMDRRWMITDTDGKFITQREIPVLARIQPSFANGSLVLNAPKMSAIEVALQHEASPIRMVQVFNDLCEAWDEGDSLATWLGDYLHQSVRLVRMTDSFVRPVDERYARRPAKTSFTDGFPLLLLSEASVAELNNRLIVRGSESVPISRFRPNVVVNDCAAFAEDDWRTIQIGGMTLDVVKPCARCVTTTVDQATGTIPDHTEPLATLNTFRKQGGKVMFAQNVIHHAPGTLSVGERVQIIE